MQAGVLVALGYYVGSLTGFVFRFPSSGIAYIWPPNAILLAALLLVRRRRWPIVLGAAFAAHAVAHVQDQLPVQTWLWQFLANAAQAVLAAVIVGRFCAAQLRFDSLRCMTVFLGGAAAAAPAIGSLLAAHAYVGMGWASDYWSAWGLRTLTNIVTTMTLVPPLVMIFGADHGALKRLTLARAGEFVVLLLALFAVDSLALAIPRTAQVGLPLALYGCMPFIGWAGIRFGPSGLSICLLTVALLSINALGRHPTFAVGTSVEMILGIQLFVAISAAPLMLLSVALEESRRARGIEEALHHSEVKNAAILRAIPDLMFVLSKDRGYRYLEYYTWNPEGLFVPPERFIGRRMRDVLPPDLARSFEEVFERAIATGEPCVAEYSMELNGERRFYEARVVACEDDRLLSIVRDITQSKQAETALYRAQQELAGMSRASALGELAASIAHEVQQPLSAIGTNAAACSRWLERDAPDLQLLRPALVDIMDDARRASQVIKRTRELFSGGQRENMPVELNEAIREVLNLTRNRAERLGESFRVELANAPLVVMGDRVQIQQVMLNLIVNGLDAMRHATGTDRFLVVRSWSEEGSAHVAVRDAGQGFDPADIEHIFDPFYTTKSDGLGMGLAISRSIVRAHGGTLKATLNPGDGATFEFVLPRAG